MKTLISKLLSRVLKDKYFIIKLLKTSITRGLAAVGTFIFNFVLAKHLSITEYGYFTFAYTLIIGLGFVVRFGMTTAIMRFAGIMVSEKNYGQLKKLRKDVFFISMIGSCLLGLILILSRSLISDLFFDDSDLSTLLLIFSFSLPFYSYLTIQSSFFKAMHKPEIAPFFEVGLTTFFTGSIVALMALIGSNINSEGVALIFLMSAFLVFIAGNFTLTRLIKKETLGVCYSLEPYYGFYKTLPNYTILAVSGYLLKFSPIIILGFYASGKDVGLYSLSNSISFVINFILWIVSTVYAPHYASLHKQSQLIELKRIVISSTFYMLILAIPIFLLIITFPTSILGLFGNEFKAAKFALIIMAVGQLYNVATGPVYFLLNMTGHEKQLRNIVLITAVVSIGFSFILIPSHGFLGAAIATSLGLIFQNSYAFKVSSHYLKINIFKICR